MTGPGRLGRLAVAALLSSQIAGPALAADKALLVGVDVYADPRVPPTPGAVGDARGIAAVLQSAFGFAGEDIKLLLDEEATAENIVAVFSSWLVEGSAPGDRVFFSYAGHGSQLPDDNGDEDDGRDETLAPYDVNPETGGNQIRDDALELLISQLSGRRAVLLFDSCHSGTVTRGLPSLGLAPMSGGARYLPSPEDFKRITQSRSEGVGSRSGGSYVLTDDVGGGDKTIVDAPSRVGRLTGIIVMSAAHPGQLAYPLTVRGRERGALSYLFEQLYSDGAGTRRGLVLDTGEAEERAAHRPDATLTASSSARDTRDVLTVAALKTAIGEGIKKLQHDGILKGTQEPWFEVVSTHALDQQPLFGGWEQASAVAMSNPLSTARVSLDTVAERSRFRDGESIVFEVSSDRPGYLYLLVFSEGNVATCIFPSRDDTANRVAAGMQILPRSDKYHFPVGEPFGRDVAVAVVSEERLPLCEKTNYTWNEIFDRVDLRAAHKELRERAKRGVKVKSGAAPEIAPGLRWQAASLVLETEPAGNPADQR